MHLRRGFTIIEVMLFLGISGFLIIGLMVGTSATIARQRYNDSVEDLAEFFRREYAAAINIQNSRTDTVDNRSCNNDSTSNNDEDGGVFRGRSGCLIYGRLIVIGEKADSSNQDERDAIYSYDVIGRELNEKEKSRTISLPEALKLASVNVLVQSSPRNPAGCTFQPINQSRYSPQWLATIENTTTGRLRASILIVRSPMNGTVHTLVLKGTALQVQNAATYPCTSNVAKNLLPNVISNFSFAPDTTTPDTAIDLCVGSDDIFAFSGRRRNVRILRDGHNSSAVEIVSQDNVFDKTTNPRGNRCRE